MTESVKIPKHLASEHATMNVPTASPDDLVRELRSGLTGRKFDLAEEVVVLEGGIAIGLVTLENLFACPDGGRVREIMDPEPPSVGEDTDQELVAHKMVKHGGGCVIVTGPAGQFRGLVCSESMLEVLLTEHDEDLARIGGYVASSARSRSAAEEPVGRRLWHRLPWLLVGLLGAMVSALIMGAFEQTLEANVLVALFVPAIVYMAGAVGSQTQTVLIRAFAIGVTTREILVRELITGLFMGLLIGGTFLGFAVLVWGDVSIAIAVAIALFASATVAVAVALALPTFFQKLGLDPAFGSGPLATLIQDLLSISTYFAAVIIILP
ncbi:MAG: magnesium transporter [Solirubrobacterales bacterium]